MLWSLYPTDGPEVQRAVVAQTVRHGAPDGPVFTSLHLPESDTLAEHGALLRRLHAEHGLTFCGDVSPLTLERLGGGLPALDRLRDWGVTVLRIDFGFDTAEVRAIADRTGCRIALNASTAQAPDLDALGGLPLAGWHNYYPRPETGLSTATYRAQDAVFADRGLPRYAFVPGEVTFRAPLGLGLPTVEEQRHRTVWRNYLQLRRLSPGAAVVCAEGTVQEQHLAWIDHHERTGEVTVPLVGVDPAAAFLLDRPWRLRPDSAEVAFRLEETRGDRAPARLRNGDTRARGSLQMDLAGSGRYRGEVHLMRADRPLHPLQARVADVAAPYVGVVDELVPGDVVRFVRDDGR
ncbi:MupG family TIM beta-alpha barrel fold protein [Cellulosimicrobium cellulans]|uniref:MupG family TIM beta-alpha barrel fold protein n=1 Tax=Cellulosimicrobium cellulans TaxID=1710 RepID=UPI00130E0A4D|nr:MupG family TIM beta-alpha barrel fold protein [Cellulosimicrobium cellulans]